MFQMLQFHWRWSHCRWGSEGRRWRTLLGRLGLRLERVLVEWGGAHRRTLPPEEAKARKLSTEAHSARRWRDPLPTHHIERSKGASTQARRDLEAPEAPYSHYLWSHWSR